MPKVWSVDNVKVGLAAQREVTIKKQILLQILQDFRQCMLDGTPYSGSKLIRLAGGQGLDDSAERAMKRVYNTTKESISRELRVLAKGADASYEMQYCIMPLIERKIQVGAAQIANIVGPALGLDAATIASIVSQKPSKGI